MFHAILNAIIVARAKLKSVSDVYDCKRFLNVFFDTGEIWWKE